MHFNFITTQQLKLFENHGKNGVGTKWKMNQQKIMTKKNLSLLTLLKCSEFIKSTTFNKRNPTISNDRPVKKHRFNEGLKIILGSLIKRFHMRTNTNNYPNDKWFNTIENFHKINLNISEIELKVHYGYYHQGANKKTMDIYNKEKKVPKSFN